MLGSFFLIFFSLYLAQMGDKTQLLTLYLATKTKKHVLLFFAILTAYLISEAFVVLFGAAIGTVVPQGILHAVSGVVFIVLGIFLFRDGKKSRNKQKKMQLHHLFFTTILLIFMADFGDKTQIAIALFATIHNPFLVYAAAIAALGIDTIIIICFSKFILKKVKESIIEKVSGILFVVIGILLLFHVIQ